MQRAATNQSQGLLSGSAPRATPAQVPKTSEAMDGLAAQRRELQRQLEDLADRREELVDTRDEVSGDRTELDARIKLMDARSLDIERQLIVTDDAIAQGLAAGVTWGPNGAPSGYVTGQSQAEIISDAVQSAAEDAVFGAMATGVFTVLGLVVVWRGIRRFVFRRKTPAAALVDTSPRLEALQQSVDVIALEMERVSEAQRFLAKALNERLPAAAAASKGGEAGVNR